MDENTTDITVFAEQFGVLVSREIFPIVVEYGDGHLRVAGRGTTQPLLRRLLPEALPSGLTFIAR